ncbi:hypothetical protein [Helicobacter suis]|uniref:hypothetical protein n=1 Tax=Helicobacter suis TaxID=104628 RepID=UPI0021FA645B|nr:hypothetical protein [Helicobacter suis]BDR28636.1 hypothetical protein HSHS1_13970 [Helicobacter suis HS1]
MIKPQKHRKPRKIHRPSKPSKIHKPHKIRDTPLKVKYSSALKKMLAKKTFTNVLCEILLKYKGDIHQMLGAYAFLTSKKVDLDKLIHGSALAR